MITLFLRKCNFWFCVYIFCYPSLSPFCDHLNRRYGHRMHLNCPWLYVPVHSRLCGRSYLMKFLIRNLSYIPCDEPSRNIPCDEPSRTVLFPDVMFTMYARHLSKHNSPPLSALFIIPPWVRQLLIGNAANALFFYTDNATEIKL